MKRIDGYYAYAVLNSSQVWSYKHHKFLKQQLNHRGYLQVKLYDNGKHRTFTVHRLVATSFIDNSERLPFINHKDGDKTNNRASNLEWCSNQYNKDHAMRSGNFKSKLSIEDVLNIRQIGKSKPYSKTAAQYGITRMMVYRIVTNKSWQHLP